MRITASVLDYLGKYEGGILVSVGLVYENTFYNSIFYYTSDKMIISIDDDLATKIGEIEFSEDYIPLMESIINMVEPYEEMINQVKDYDFNW